ncbi:DUF2291 family protein [Arenibacter sp. M-2]|uniref:DUF2291 family protein n=1 Tax=Arenibacter sp. M-2 TaxID=3053612 RepID=UPI002570AA19|nr:DUF2291 family protein [Arenibacter sp. M-2]MDL5513523.1 DUF2291 family protein [Arenibacter sp. M-2]|tara:strand:- start:21584 stop:22222 length:639 start_codon:yes stop_codon:yes gene_type:complete
MAVKNSIKKTIKYLLIALLVGVALYNSVYFEPLDERHIAQKKGVFDPDAFAQKFMETKLTGLPAMEAGQFMEALEQDLEQFTAEKGRKMGISNDYYFIVEGNGIVLDIGNENVRIKLEGVADSELLIATDFIFGNAIREGSGMASIGDFQNTMDFNSISVAVNNRVRTDVVPPFLNEVEEGDHVYFKGAVEVNTKHPDLPNLRIIPLILEIE